MTALALAERVERLAGPDREVDAEIWDSLGLVDEAHCHMWCRMDGRTDLTRAMFVAAWAPEFTGSIDAALALLDPSWTLQMHWFRGRALAAIWSDAGEPIAQHSGATLALALVAAALRARAGDG